MHLLTRPPVIEVPISVVEWQRSPSAIHHINRRLLSGRLFEGGIEELLHVNSSTDLRIQI